VEEKNYSIFPRMRMKMKKKKREKRKNEEENKLGCWRNVIAIELHISMSPESAK
jgi:hypothetical protein